MNTRQEGWTLLGMLIVISVVMFFAYITIRLIPVYLDNEEVKHAMEVGLSKGDPATMNRTQIISNMYNQMVIDDTDYLTDWKKAVTYKKTRDGVMFATTYQRVVPLFYNISLQIDFHNVIEIPSKPK